MWVLCVSFGCGCHLDAVWVSCGICVSVGVMLVLCVCHLGVVWVSFGCEVIKNDVSSVNS